MKRFLSFLCIITLLVTTAFSFSSCLQKGEEEIKLTEENYLDYLNVEQVEGGYRADMIFSGIYAYPRMQVEVSPKDDTYVFRNTSLTIEVTYCMDSGDMDYKTKEITIPIGSDGCGTKVVDSSDSDYTVYYCNFKDYTFKSIKGTAIITCLHEWDDGKTVEPASCTSEGVTLISCTKCDKTREEKLEQLEHEFISEPISTEAPTCLEEGNEVRFCERCGENVTVKIDALGHNFTEENTTSVEATCTENAYKKQRCDRCYTTEKTVVENSALGHEYGEDGRCIRCNQRNYY